jgi:hypothetical protein
LQGALPLGLRPVTPSSVAPIPTPALSNSVPELDVPVPVDPDVVVELPIGVVELPIVVVVVLDVPMPEHPPETGPGLRPGVASSVAPMGIPVVPTDELLGVIPRGDVVPIPGLAPGTAMPTWA